MNRTGLAVGAVAIAIIASSFACTDLDPQAAVAKSVDITTGLSTIQVGQTIQATAAARNTLGASMDGVEVSWSSSNPTVATVSNTGLVAAVAPGTSDVTASALGLSASVLLTVVPASPTAAAISITTQPPASAASGAAFATQPSVQLRDAAGAPVASAGVIVTASIATGGGALGGLTIGATNATGLATFGNLSITGTVGTRTLSFSAPGFPSVPSGNIDITAGAASALTITNQPSTTVQSAVALAAQPAVQIRDASGNPVSQAGITVTAAIASGGGTLGGATSVMTDASGVATFTDLAITGAAGSRTLSFTASALTAVTSDAIAVTAGTSSPSGVTITTQPSVAAQSGVALVQQPVIQLRDGTGSVVNQAGVSVTAAIATGGGTLAGTATVATNASGVATFTNLSITGIVGSRTLTFTSGSLTSATSGTITLNAGAPTDLTITTQPADVAQAGVALGRQPIIQVRDANGNAVKQAAVSVTAAIASGGGTLSGTATVAADANGVATFTNLSIAGTPGPRTLTFTSGILTAATSSNIDITAPVITPSKLATALQPSATALSGATFAQQPVIQVLDSAGNAVSQAGISVAAAIATGGGALGGTATAATNASGVATFTNLSITGTPGARTLGFTSGSLTATASNAITVSAGALSALAITTQPAATSSSGLALPVQPVLQLLDGGGNAVSQAGVSVAAAIASGGGSLSGTATVQTNASGVATFTNLVISGTVGPRTLAFTSGSLTGATSSSIDLTPPPSVSIATQPSATAQSGTAFAQQPVIQLRDGSGNPLGQAGVTVTAAIATGAGTLGGTATATTNASGVATFGGLTITGTIGARTLSFTATGFGTVASSTINITAGAASSLGITTQPSTPTQSGAAFAQQPVIQLRDGSGNAVSQAGVNVTAVIATGGGTLGGTPTATTNASGVATFSGLSITGTIGARTLSFSATGLGTVASSSINITAGAATALSITTQPATTAQSGSPFSRQPLIQLRDASGNAVSQTGVNVTAAIASGAAALGGTTTVATNSSGVAIFTNLSITGPAGTRTLTFTSGALTAPTSGSIDVTVPPPPPPPGATEPVFVGGTNTMIYQDNMDGYADVTTMGANPQGSTPRITPHPAPVTTSTPVEPGAQLITGRGGSGKALRLSYTGANQGEVQFITLNMPNTPDNTTHYVSYWARIQSSAPFTSSVPIKWLEMWHKHVNDRIQFNTHDPMPCGIGSFSKTYWEVIDTRETACDGRQPLGPWFNDLVNDGQFHRFTYQFKANSAPGARDGVARMWVDGVKIIDISLATVGVTPPGGEKTWCELDDVDALIANDGVRDLWFGSTQTLPSPAWSFDVDDLTWWR